MSQTKRPLIVSLFVAVLLTLGAAPVAHAQSTQEFEVSEMAILGDILIAKPASIVMTGVGFVAYTAILPFSVLAQSEDELAEKMVKRPARSAFLRCVGCTPDQDESRRITRQVEEKAQQK